MENGKDNIIRRIQQDTDNAVNAILAEAQQQADAIIAEAEQSVADDNTKAVEKQQADCQEKLRRANVSAQMQGRLYLLQRKQQLIADVYNKVAEQIVALPDKEYAAFVDKMLAEYAEKGETLVISPKDDKRITKQIADKYGLTLRADGKFDGGFVLEGNGYQKVATVDAVVKQLRLTTESKTSLILFNQE